MRRHPKASPVRSINGSGRSRDQFGRSRGTRGGSGHSDGRSAPSTRLLGLLVALTCLATLAFGAGIARAEIFYGQVGELEGSSLPAWPEKYSAGALQESTGYVFDVNSSTGVVFVFESDAPGAGVLTTFGEGELSSPAGIAIDQTDGSIYIADAGNNRIVRYTSNGATPPVYARDTTYTSPAHGSGSGEIGDFAAQLAFDPSTGDLLVADSGNKRVERFDPSGNFLGSFDGSGAPSGAFKSLNDVAPGPDGTIYVIADGTIVDEFFQSETTGSVVEHFDADGTFLDAVGLEEYEGSARTLTFDTKTNSLLVATNRGGSRVVVFRGGARTQVLVTNPPELFITDLIAPVTGTGTVISINIQNPFYPWSAAGVWNSFDLEPVVKAPSAITGTSAHLVGTINTNEATEVTVHFEYRAIGDRNWTSTPDQGAAVSSTPEPIEADISGLLPAQGYEVRLSATRPGLQTDQPQQSNVFSGVTTFQTEIVAPVTVTQGATGITGSAATLNGSVNAEGSATRYYFEYGPSTDYGLRAPAGEVPAGSGRAPHRFSVGIAGLSPGSTYHFRIVATNGAGTSFGGDAEFTTPATAPPGRAYEQVTPVDQEGGNINGSLGVEALPAAEGISYVTTPVGGGAQSAPKEARVMSIRGSADWNPQIHVDPPFNARTGLNFALTAAVSDDGTHALVASNRALAPGGAEDREAMNFYVKDLRDGSYKFVAKVEGEFATAMLIKELRHTVMAASPDFSWIVFWSANSLLPGTPESNNREANEGKGVIYRWSVTDGLEVVSRTTGSVRGMRYLHWETLPVRQVSADGERIFFQQETGVYLRDGSHTVPVSVSDIDDSIQPAELLACSESGRYVFFTAGRLTLNAPEGQQSLYRYDVDSKKLEFASAEGPPNWERILGISPDGSTVYWIAGPGGGQTLMWRNGEQVALPSPVGGPLNAGVGTLQISPNSRYAGIQLEPSTFYSSSDLYLWNAETHQLSCASCDAGERTFKAEIPTSGSFELIGVYRLPQWVGNDGSVYFTSSAGLVPSDVNGVDDVYAYSEGQQELISSGDANFPALYMDIGNDGRDVYFLTNQPLVARDTNRSSDIYDARVSGGFTVQNEVPSPPCLGEACQSPGGGAPAANSVGSETVPPSAKAKAKKVPKPKNCKKKSRGKGATGRARAKKSCQKAKGGKSKKHHGRNPR